MTLWTIGHSTRSVDEFLSLLRAHGIGAVADVRRYPGSRRHPQFGQQNLMAELRAAGIVYAHFPALGGRRKPQANSPNTAWRHASFRGYADYMATTEFHAGVSALLELALDARVAVMCAEAVWWRCHRGLIADFLKANGHEVLHINGPAAAEPHPFTSAARMEGESLTYSSPPDLLD